MIIPHSPFPSRPATLGEALVRPRSPDQTPTRPHPLLQRLTWSLIRWEISRRHQLAIEGLENLPTEGPVVIVANHGSHLDTLLIGSAMPGALRSRFSPLAAGDTFFKDKVRSWLSSRFLNLKPLWRRRCHPNALMDLRRSLVSDESCLLVFPEGTRSRTGTMGRFKPGIGMLVAGTSIPVVPCFLDGTFDAWPPNRRLPRRGTLRLRVGKPLTFDSRPGNSDHWRDISRELEAAVCRLGQSNNS